MPDMGDVYVDPSLTNTSIKYDNAEYIGRRAVPLVDVAKPSGKFYEFSKPEWFRDEAGPRAETTTGPVGGFNLSTRDYSCAQFSMATYVADEERDAQDPGIDLDMEAADYCTDKILLQYERQVAGLVFNASSYAAGHAETLTGDARWDNAASDPITAVKAAKLTISQSAPAVRANTLIIGPAVKDALTNHAKLIERIKYTQTGILTTDLLRALFEVDRVLVGYAVVNTAKEGAAPSYEFIWGKKAALIYTPPRPMRKTPSFAYAFVWDAVNFLIERWRKSDGGAADGFRSRTMYDLKLTGNTLGYYWDTAVA